MCQVGTVEIHVVERYMLSFLRPLILHRLRKQIPEDRHKNTVVVFGGLEVTPPSSVDSPCI